MTPRSAKPGLRHHPLSLAAGIAALGLVRAIAADPAGLTEIRDARGAVIALVNPSAERGPKEAVAGKGLLSGTTTAGSRLYCSPVAVPDPAESSRTFLAANAHSFGITDSESELAEGSVTGDDLGMTHLFYRQQHRGVPVYGAALVSHVNHRGEVVSVNGRTLADTGINTTPAISPSAAISIARSATGREAEFSASRIPSLQLLNKTFLGLAATGEEAEGTSVQTQTPHTA